MGTDMVQAQLVDYDDDLVTMRKKRYEQLLRAELWANALDRAGVNNWDWYSEAVAEYAATLEEWGLEDE